MESPTQVSDEGLSYQPIVVSLSPSGSWLAATMPCVEQPPRRAGTAAASCIAVFRRTGTNWTFHSEAMREVVRSMAIDDALGQVTLAVKPAFGSNADFRLAVLELVEDEWVEERLQTVGAAGWVDVRGDTLVSVDDAAYLFWNRTPEGWQRSSAFQPPSDNTRIRQRVRLHPSGEAAALLAGLFAVDPNDGCGPELATFHRTGSAWTVSRQAIDIPRSSLNGPARSRRRSTSQPTER